MEPDRVPGSNVESEEAVERVNVEMRLQVLGRDWLQRLRAMKLVPSSSAFSEKSSLA